MQFPDKAKKVIADTFYDKEVAVLEKTETLDAEGGVVKNSTTIKSTFKGNVRFIALGEEQNELGLVENIDIQITCPTDTAVEVDDLLQYAGVKYVAVSVLPSDSHKTIWGQKWQRSR